jgi:TRAP-type transport system periplasmic protein
MEQYMRKLLFIMAGCLLAVSAAGCTNAAAAVSVTQSASASPTAEPVSLTVSCAGTCEECLNDAVKRGIGDVKTWSEGQLNICFKKNQGNGSDADVLKSVEEGTASVYLGDASAAEEIIRPLTVCEIPMMFSDTDSCNSMLSAGFIEMMQPYFNVSGLQLIGAYCSSMRCLTSNKAITSAGDIKSLKIRTGNDRYDELFWKSAGSFPYALDWPNVYTALKKNMLEAQGVH